MLLDGKGGGGGTNAVVIKLRMYVLSCMYSMPNYTLC